MTAEEPEEDSHWDWMESLRIAGMYGISLTEWEAMTPWQMRTIIAGRQEAQRQRQELTQVNLYSLACCIRAAVWSRDAMPAYEELFGGSARKDMDDEALFAAVTALNAKLGGRTEQEDE